jgi:arabinose-5-phosphate isomerase
MIKLVVFDFDGVFTNGKCNFGTDDVCSKYYNIKDGMGISILREQNILVGLISSFKCDKQVHWNDTKVMNAISSHLMFNFSHVGSGNKIEILNKWLVENDLTYEEVAYIGDDINDIDIMKSVKISACPSDAAVECKQCVNYICKAKGGEGCVREFVTFITRNIKPTLQQEIKQEINHQIDNFDFQSVERVAEIIHNARGIVYFLGVGKSGNIAKHCCDLLKSISVKAFYLDPINILHGDIGTICENDIIIMFSKSGSTAELMHTIHYIRERKVILIGVCCNVKSQFHEICDVIVQTPFRREISGDIDVIPTNSFMSHLLFSNILTALLKKYLDKNDYRSNHPAGFIGRDLKKVKDVITSDFPKVILQGGVSLHSILLEMTNKRIGCCCFVDTTDKLLGIMTDGDIRRLLLSNGNITTIDISHINTQFVSETDTERYLSSVDVNILPILKDGLLHGVALK